MEKILWTVGHSTLTLEAYIHLLQQHQIRQLIDVRSLPGSNKYPHFNQENLAQVLPEHQIDYVYIKQLGGLRPAHKNSLNIAWRNKSFRNYADYMETESFREGIDLLIGYATEKRSAITCAEAVWWRCHRSMIADYMKSIGWQVLHIQSPVKTELHPYTGAASIIDGRLSYREENPVRPKSD